MIVCQSGRDVYVSGDNIHSSSSNSDSFYHHSPVEQRKGQEGHWGGLWSFILDVSNPRVFKQKPHWMKDNSPEDSYMYEIQVQTGPMMR